MMNSRRESQCPQNFHSARSERRLRCDSFALECLDMEEGTLLSVDIPIPGLHTQVPLSTNYGMESRPR
jgi:hypothetical protein